MPSVAGTVTEKPWSGPYAGWTAATSGRDSEALVATPYASGLAALVDDEAHLGVACIDFGGATTTVAVFADGHPVYCDALAIGGHHLTLDIARQLSVSIADAERLKTVYGSVLPGQADERELISIVPVGAGADEAPGMIPRITSGCANIAVVDA